MADFAASAGMELFHVGKFGIFRTRTPPFLTGSGRVSGPLVMSDQLTEWSLLNLMARRS